MFSMSAFPFSSPVFPHSFIFFHHLYNFCGQISPSDFDERVRLGKPFVIEDAGTSSRGASQVVQP
jgi:hypothetical protein